MDVVTLLETSLAFSGLLYHLKASDKFYRVRGDSFQARTGSCALIIETVLNVLSNDERLRFK